MPPKFTRAPEGAYRDVERVSYGFCLVQFGSCTSAFKGSCIQNIGSSAARVCSFSLASLSLRQEMVEKVQKRTARWTCRQWRNQISVVLDELEWPSREDCRVKSSLTFFYKIHSGTVSLDKDKYLTPASNLKTYQDIS